MIGNFMPKTTVRATFLHEFNCSVRKHRHRQKQDAHVKKEVENRAEKELHVQVPTMLERLRANLSVVLDGSADGKEGDGAADKQAYRQQRVNKALDLSKRMNAKRLPEAERAKLPPGAIGSDESLTRGDGREPMWLYEPGLAKEASRWMQELEGS
ncbi:hypothetical protein BS50DRAFT_633230 [Corynespora cassiicola Philippines]|uniref:Uncharacterized protein n=1 Tax=Corynespora cassiicola Philippines TaxID=1448308 RepID=A0A2T2NVN3_CORCC|nr:hypothetical protein BS50DRAFT_633230 [Corynespora cassiicola Philippines]